MSVEEGIGAFWILVGVVSGVAAAIGLAKLAWRRSRYLTSDPRRIAGAARRELADFLVDQGLTVDASATPEDLHQLVRSTARHRRTAVRRGRRGRTLRAARRERGGRSRHPGRAEEAAARDPRQPGEAAAAARLRHAALPARVVLPAVVLAAGLGTRLRPLREHVAKPLLPIDGRPVPTLLLRELAAAGSRA